MVAVLAVRVSSTFWTVRVKVPVALEMYTLFSADAEMMLSTIKAVPSS